MENNRRLVSKVTDYVNEKVAPPLIKISQMRYLDTLQKTFITLMPYLLLGATFTLILNLGNMFDPERGLNLPIVQEAINNFIAPHKPWMLQIVFVTNNLLALLTCVLNGYYLGEYYANKDKNVSLIGTAIVSLTGFLCFIDFSKLSENFDWPNYILGSPSLFGAIVISIISVEIYRFIIGKNITIKMPESVPPMVAKAFISLIPVFTVLIFLSILGKGFENFDLLANINSIFTNLVTAGAGWLSQFIAFMLDRLLWFVGLHGSNIVGSVMSPIWTQMITENINAFNAQEAIPYMFTNQWINAYVRLSVFPLALLCTMSKVKRFNVLGKLSLPASVFNIAEPIMYGLPIVLNPLMFIPWVIGFGGLFIFNVVLSMFGLTPPMVTVAVWTLPVPLMSFIGSGFKFGAMLLTLINMVILFFIYYPFFKAMEKNELEKELYNNYKTNN